MLVALLILIVVAQTIGLLTLMRKRKKVEYDGTVQIYESDGTKTFSFEPDGDLYDLDQRKEVRLKVELNSVGDRA